MNQTLIWFVIACLLWVALLYWIFIVRREPDLGAGGRSAIVIVGGLIIPVLIAALWIQSQSVSRLEKLGLTVFDGLGSTVGIAAGIGENPIWVFELDASEADALNFYRDPGNHQSWSLRSSTENSLTLTRGNAQLQIQATSGNATFLVSEPETGAHEDSQ